MLNRRKRVSRSWNKVQVHRLSLTHEHQLSMVRATRVRLSYGNTQTEDEEPRTWMVRRSLNSPMYMNFLPGVEIDPERPRDDPATTPRRPRDDHAKRRVSTRSNNQWECQAEAPLSRITCWPIELVFVYSCSWKARISQRRTRGGTNTSCSLIETNQGGWNRWRRWARRREPIAKVFILNLIVIVRLWVPFL